MTVSRVNNFVGANTGASAAIGATYTTANLTANNFMFAEVVASVNSGTPSTTSVGATGGTLSASVALTKIYDSGTQTDTNNWGTAIWNISWWIAQIPASAGKPTVTAQVSGAATSAGIAMMLEELHESTGATSLAVDGTPTLVLAPSGNPLEIVGGSYSSSASANLLLNCYGDWGLNDNPSVSPATGFTEDAEVNNGNTQLIILSQAAKGGAESAYTFNPNSGENGFVLTAAIKAGGGSPKTNTQPANARIQASPTKTQSGIAHINAGSAKTNTQPATARIRDVGLTKTQSGTALIVGNKFVTGVSSNGRYLVDQNGDPFLVNMDSFWALDGVDMPSQQTVTGPSAADQATYLYNRVLDGFNAVLFSIGTPSSTDGNGHTPWTTYPTMDTSGYWTDLDALLQLCTKYGISVFLDVMDAYAWTNNGSSALGTAANAQAYGNALATRWPQADYPGIVWCFGNDYGGSGVGSGNGVDIDTLYEGFMTGLSNAGDTRPITIELGYYQSLSTDSATWASRVNINWVYSYQPTYGSVLRAHAYSTKTLPALHGESVYENAGAGNPHPDTDLDLRKVILWPLTSGACGATYGNDTLWPLPSGWQSSIRTTITGQRATLQALWQTLRWWKLAPDSSSNLVTSGRNSQYTTNNSSNSPLTNDSTYGNYVTAAYSADGGLAVIYNPTSSTNSSVVVSSSVLGASPVITRYDPTNGASHAGPTFSSGTANLGNPGTNAGGDNDWLYVITAQFNTSTTQTGIARIQTLPTKTQSANARIQASRTKTQTGVARIKATVTKTQSANARISKGLTKTQNANARIQANVTKTQSANARLQASVTKTQSANAHVSVAASNEYRAFSASTGNGSATYISPNSFKSLNTSLARDYGLVFQARQSNYALKGISLAVPSSYGSFNVNDNGASVGLWKLTYVPNGSNFTLSASAVVATVLTGDLTGGVWNDVFFSSPITLENSALIQYVAVWSVGSNTWGMSWNNNNAGYYFGGSTTGSQGSPGANAGPGAYGIDMGPAFIWSADNNPGGGASASPLGYTNGIYSSTTDDLTYVPDNGLNDNYGIDLIIEPSAGAGTYSLYDHSNTEPNSSSSGQYTLAVQFAVSKRLALTGIWFWSGTGAAILPSQTAIFDADTQTIISGTLDTSPNWVTTTGASAVAGDGWVMNSNYATGGSLAGTMLSSGINYFSAVYSLGGSAWFTDDGPGQWTTGITNGPLSAPSATNALAATGQSPFSQATGGIHSPTTIIASGYNFFVDVQVTDTYPDITVVDEGTSGGITTYYVTSDLNSTNGSATYSMRVVVPNNPASATYSHSFLWMLPVEPDQGTTYGDPLAQAATIGASGLANEYNATLIQPGFAISPWYADNPTDTTASQETFLMELVNWVNDPTNGLTSTGTEKHYLMGFSKSGLGGSGLLFRHPTTFYKGGFWDFPAMMTDYDGTDATYAAANGGAKVGGGSSADYGTSANFTTNYELSQAHLDTWSTGTYNGASTAFNVFKRVWIGGSAAFGQDVNAYLPELNSASILYDSRIVGGDTHAWHADWMSPAADSMFAGIIAGSNTQPANARIQTTPTKTQSAVARLQANVTHTQSANGRLQSGVTKTQSANSRISKGLTKTQSATSDIAKSFTNTQSADARISKGITKTQTANARISAGVTKTQAANARLRASVTKTQSADALIAGLGTRTNSQSATATIQASASKTQSADARIQKSLAKTQSGKARLTTSRTLTQAADSRLQVNLQKTQGATARLQKSLTFTQSANGRVRSSVTKTQAADASIVSAGTRVYSQNATARLVNTVAHTQSATGRVSKGLTKTQSADAFINLKSTKTIQGVGRIQTTGTHTQTADANLVVKGARSTTQTANAHIVVSFSASKTQTATALLYPKLVVQWASTGVFTPGNPLYGGSPYPPLPVP